MVAQRAWPLDPAYLDIDEIATEKARRHLREFVKQAWHVVEPSTPYVHNWHIDALCDHLEATLDGRIRNLLITMPPRAMKSLTVSVFFPAWAWINHPELRFLYASYASQLATEHSQLTRMVIESDWYQARWGDRVQLMDDDNLKTRFSNTALGKRIATSVGASVTGFGGDYVIVDDPHNVQQVESESIRAAAVRWWNKAMSTRLNNPRTGVRIVVMQRVHETDVAGSVLGQGTYTHLNLPMEYEPTDYVGPNGWTDPRTEPDELLWPDRYPPAAIERLKTELGSYDYAAQFQQRPAPAAGGILKAHWFGVYAAPQPRYHGLIQTWDTAIKLGDGHDYSAGLTLGIATDGYDVLDVWRDRVDYLGLKQAVRDQATLWTARYPGIPFSLLIEDKASGASLIQELAKTTRLPILPVSDNRPDAKRLRAIECTPTLEAGRVRLPAVAAWREVFLAETTAFPNGAHDDMVDTLTFAVQRAAGIGPQTGGTVTETAYWQQPQSRRAHARS